MNEENKPKMSFSENAQFLTSVGIYTTAWAIFALDVLLNQQPFPEITSHARHFIYAATPIIVSDNVGLQIYKLGKKKGSEFVQKVADYVPSIIASSVIAYGAIGETVADIIPLNTMSPEHVPAIVLGGVTTYITANAIYDAKKEKLENKLE